MFGGKTIGAVFDEALLKSIWASGIGGLFSTVMYIMVKGQSLMWFVYYMKRMVTVGFLIMIAPLITITYALDKLGDNKAQAFNTWLKELGYNILIQPFHCILYVAFFGAIAEMLNESNYNISAYILAFVVFLFMRKAEEILKHIFHFEAKSGSSMMETGQQVANAMGTFRDRGMAMGKSIASFKAAGGIRAIKDDMSKISLDRKAAKSAKEDFLAKGGNKKDFKKYMKGQDFTYTDRAGNRRTMNYEKEFEKHRSVKAQEMNNQKAEKAKKKFEKKNGAGSFDKEAEKRAREAYDAQHGSGKFDENIENETKAKYDAENGRGAYDTLKRMAGNGRPSGARAAQKLENLKSETIRDSQDKSLVNARNKIYNETTFLGSAGRKINGVKKKVGKYTNMRGVQFIGEQVKDMSKVTLVMASAAMAMGYSGDLKDGVSAGQAMSGFIDGFKKSARTIQNEINDTMEKYLKQTGQSTNDLIAIMSNIMNKGDNKGYEKIGDKEQELQRRLETMGASQAQIRNLLNQINISATLTHEDVDIEGAIRRMGITGADADTAFNLTNEYSTLKMESHVYSKMQEGKPLNMDPATSAYAAQANLDRR